MGTSPDIVSMHVGQPLGKRTIICVRNIPQNGNSNGAHICKSKVFLVTLQVVFYEACYQHVSDHRNVCQSVTLMQEVLPHHGRKSDCQSR